jgi:hypothetical protein
VAGIGNVFAHDAARRRKCSAPFHCLSAPTAERRREELY